MKTILLGAAFALSLVTPMLGQQDDTVYTAGNGVSLPIVITDVRPLYTPDAMKRRVTGSVLLQCVVDRAGVPTNLEVIESLDEELDRASLNALKQWRFEPGKKDGKAVLVRVEVKMAFTLK